MLVYHLGIDPSVKSCGWALLASNEKLITKLHLDNLRNWDYGAIKTKGKTYEWQLCEIREFFKTFRKFNIKTLVIEMPGFYNSETGRIAAKQGYTIGLGAVLGVVIGTLDISSEQIFFYTAPAWKGSVPKWITYKKLVRTFADSYLESGINLSHQHDIVDAIMLLHFHMIHNHNLTSNI